MSKYKTIINLTVSGCGVLAVRSNHFTALNATVRSYRRLRSSTVVNQVAPEVTFVPEAADVQREIPMVIDYC